MASYQDPNRRQTSEPAHGTQFIAALRTSETLTRPTLHPVLKNIQPAVRGAGSKSEAGIPSRTFSLLQARYG